MEVENEGRKNKLTVHGCYQVGTIWRSRVDDAGYTDRELIRNELGAQAIHVRAGLRGIAMSVALMFRAQCNKVVSDREEDTERDAQLTILAAGAQVDAHSEGTRSEVTWRARSDRDCSLVVSADAKAPIVTVMDRPR